MKIWGAGLIGCGLSLTPDTRSLVERVVTGAALLSLIHISSKSMVSSSDSSVSSSPIK